MRLATYHLIECLWGMSVAIYLSSYLVPQGNAGGNISSYWVSQGSEGSNISSYWVLPWGTQYDGILLILILMRHSIRWHVTILIPMRHSIRWYAITLIPLRHSIRWYATTLILLGHSIRWYVATLITMRHTNKMICEDSNMPSYWVPHENEDK
jgi:hypothetical protein